MQKSRTVGMQLRPSCKCCHSSSKRILHSKLHLRSCRASAFRRGDANAVPDVGTGNSSKVVSHVQASPGLGLCLAAAAAMLPTAAHAASFPNLPVNTVPAHQQQYHHQPASASADLGASMHLTAPGITADSGALQTHSSSSSSSSPAAPAMTMKRSSATRRHQHGGDYYQPPLLALSSSGLGGWWARFPWWMHLSALVAANVMGVKMVQELYRAARDRAEPVTLLRVQLGLLLHEQQGGLGGLTLPGSARASLKQLRSRLAELASMIQVGQHGQWLILEEAVLELAKQQKATALADVSVVHLDSKSEAYALFNEVANLESGRARAEEASAHLEGEGQCSVNWVANADAATAAGANSVGRQHSNGLLGWLSGSAATTPIEGGCEDALVVTLVVAARGHVDAPSKVSSWQELCSVLKSICGLSSEQLMAVDLTWAPSHDGIYLTHEELLSHHTNLKHISH